MMRVTFTDPTDIAHLIDGLLEAAERWESERPSLARRYVRLADRLADRLGDELDAMPYPSAYRAEVEARRAAHRAAVRP